MTKITTATAAKPRKPRRARQAPATVPQPAATPDPVTDQAPPPSGKLGLVVGLLRRPDGASLPELMQATGWQAHSVRGAIAGAIKKKLSLKVISTKSDAGRIYRIEAADDAA